MPEKEYHRLTRARSRSIFALAFTSRSSLWLGMDHLLCIDSSGYTEGYKRFYFRDIQAITVMASKRRAVWNWVLVVPMTFCLAGLLTVLTSRQPSNTASIVVLTIFSLIFAMPLLINSLRGPTCICHLRTAVQLEELPSLSRLPLARKVLDRIRPMIVAVQGHLPPEEISSRMQAVARSPAVAATVSGGAAQPSPGTGNPDEPLDNS